MRLKSISIVEGPAIEPVSLAEALSSSKVDDAGRSGEIRLLISGARELVENYTGRALISQKLVLTLPNWDAGMSRSSLSGGIMSRRGVFESLSSCGEGNVIFLERSPLISVESVKYYDENDTLQTMPTSNYRVLKRQLPGAIELKPSASWPNLADRSDAVEINFTAGHGTESADVPALLRIAVELLVKKWIDEDFAAALPKSIADLPMGIRHMIESHRVEGWVR